MLGRKNKKYYWVYSHENYGFNYRMSEINAALALSQLEKINSFIKKRKNIASRYSNLLSQLEDYIYIPKYQNF